MFTLSTADALDYTAVFEDAAEELHILGKLVPPHYQYTGASDEVSAVAVDRLGCVMAVPDCSQPSGTRPQRSASNGG